MEVVVVVVEMIAMERVVVKMRRMGGVRRR